MAELKKIIIDGVKYDLPTGGGGSSQVFEDVNELPSEPDSNKIYRVNNSEVGLYTYDEYGNLINLKDMIEHGGGSLEIIRVSKLPENPKSSDMNTMTAVFYIVGQDIYSHNITGDNTWLSNNELAIALEFPGYGGIISSLNVSDMQVDYVYVYISNSYSYVNVINGEQFEFANNKGTLIYEETIENDNESAIVLYDAPSSNISSCDKLYLEIESVTGANVTTKINAESINKTELLDSSGSIIEYTFIISVFTMKFAMSLFVQKGASGTDEVGLTLVGNIVNDNTAKTGILKGTLTIGLYKMK